MTGARCSGGAFDWRMVLVSTGFVLAISGLSSPVLARDAAVDPPAQPVSLRRLAALPPVAPPPGVRIRIDHSGRREAGTASIYAHFFVGRKMASGRRYDPHASIAASRSLPLGTHARVTNLDTGKSTEVTIEDRGPFVDGRVVDLTPHAARAIGLTMKQGLAPVIVAPIAVPQRDGTVRPGAGAASLEGQEEASR